MVLSITEPAGSLFSFQNQPVVDEQLVLLENDDNLRLVASLLLLAASMFLGCIYLAAIYLCGCSCVLELKMI